MFLLWIMTFFFLIFYFMISWFNWPWNNKLTRTNYLMAKFLMALGVNFFLFVVPTTLNLEGVLILWILVKRSRVPSTLYSDENRVKKNFLELNYSTTKPSMLLSEIQLLLKTANLYPPTYKKNIFIKAR